MLAIQNDKIPVVYSTKLLFTAPQTRAFAHSSGIVRPVAREYKYDKNVKFKPT